MTSDGDSHNLDLRLAQFNRRWEARLALFRRQAPPPWWAPGLVLDAALRARYESWLPVGEYLHDLGGVAALALPAPEFLPYALRPAAGCGGGAGHPEFLSLPDLWATLPDAQAGRVPLDAATLVPLLCALADPPRFGTDFGRYPEQLERLAEFARSWHAAAPAGAALRLLDIGCGTGQGTLELAAAVAAACGVRSISAVGVTREPLEAWMAGQRCLPHDAERGRRFAAFALPLAATVQFVAGDALRLPASGPVDLIVANGLVGGRFLRTPQALNAFFADAERVLAPVGWLAMANQFHDGDLRGVQAALALAQARGWQVTGDPRLALLRRRGLNP